MKTQFKSPIKSYAPVFLMLAAMFVLGFGCNIFKPMPDPLAGFHAASKNPPQVIVNDSQNYIQALSPKEWKYARVSGYKEDAVGQHAVVIEIDLNGTAWNHVLIYDAGNKRIKVIKYVAFHYRS